MARNGGPICESFPSIDVRRWYREGRLRADQHFQCSWTWGGQLIGSISVHTKAEAVVLKFRLQNTGAGEWKSVEQLVPIIWTTCHLGGDRAWFRCNVSSNGRFCGRRVALLYAAGELFACRRCYRLAYASQRECLRLRGLGRAQKIRMQLGGSGNMFEDFPRKPKWMHWQTYARLRHTHDIAAARSTSSAIRSVDTFQGRAGRVKRWDGSSHRE
jgi:hypothetical protein